MKYYIIHENNNICGIGLSIDGLIPDNCIEITLDQYSNIDNYYIKDGKCIAFNKKQLLTLENNQKYENLKQQAQILIDQNEWRWNNKIKWDRYNSKQQELLTNFYDTLVSVINKQSNILPDYNLQEELTKLNYDNSF